MGDQNRPKYTKMDIIGLNWTEWIEVDRIGLKLTEYDESGPHRENGLNRAKMDKMDQIRGPNWIEVVRIDWIETMWTE